MVKERKVQFTEWAQVSSLYLSLIWCMLIRIMLYLSRASVLEAWKTQIKNVTRSSQQRHSSLNISLFRLCHFFLFYFFYFSFLFLSFSFQFCCKEMFAALLSVVKWFLSLFRCVSLFALCLFSCSCKCLMLIYSFVHLSEKLRLVCFMCAPEHFPVRDWNIPSITRSHSWVKLLNAQASPRQKKTNETSTNLGEERERESQ